MRFLVLPVAGIVAAALYLALWAFWIEPASLATRTYALALPRWHPELGGLRVAVLADLHVGSPFNGLDNLDRVVAETNRHKPDLILLAGDYVIDSVVGGSFVPPEVFAPRLARLSAPLGVWAVLGNHDHWLGGQRVRAALEKNGIRVLEDAAGLVRTPRGAFWLVGISDFREGPHDVRKAMKAVADGRPVLAFTHNPDAFPEVDARISLLVAGHTHGGQVHLPVLGRPIVPSSYRQRYAIGHIVQDGRHLFVSPGIGTSIIPVRFRVPPEVSMLELYPQPKRAARRQE